MRIIAFVTVLLALPSLAIGQTPDKDWDKVRRLDTGTRIRVIMRDGAVKEGLAGSIVPNLAPADVAEVQRRTRGSWLGAVLGGAVGGVYGMGIAVGIATEDPCGRSCADEKFKAGLALVGLPIAGALIGAKAMPRRAWTTIYRGR